MPENGIRVVFQPGNKIVHALPGMRLQEAAMEADLVIDAPCGGEGTCGKCRVVISEGAPEPTLPERQLFSADELQAGCRLACQVQVSGPMQVLVPQTSLVGKRHQILVRSDATVQPEGPKVLTKSFVELSPPARGDDAPDAVRLECAIGPYQLDLALARELPRRLRKQEFRGTAVLAEGRLLDFEADNTEWHAYGVAVDVGTTTLAAGLVDLTTGREVCVAAKLNPQTRLGDDVLTRILFVRDQADGLAELQSMIVTAVDELIGELCIEASISRGNVYLVTIAGNTTMQQLFCGIDPVPLGEVPFAPAMGRGMSFPVMQLKLGVHPRARIYVLPVIGGFVGGDTVAGVLSTGLADCTTPTLFIDIGTNGEIVLVANGRMQAAATAAGPAFEGARINHGMRASQGAIEKIVFGDRLRTQVIGHVAPIGLCGSALIDAAAELLRHSMVTSSGRMLGRELLPAGLPDDLARRVTVHANQPAFMLADEKESADGRPILLTQRDIRELQLASGAIRAGAEILLQRAGLTPRDLDRVLLAGGFGNFIRRSNAQRIGLLPPGIEHRRIRYQGNTSLAGARLVALSQPLRARAEDLARQIEHVDLSTDRAFHETFAAAMLFPEE